MIRTVFIFIVLAMSATPCAFSDESKFAVDVIVTGSKPSTGQVLISLFNSAESYMKTPVLEAVADVDVEGKVSVVLGRHAPGAYAIVVVYDKNRNGKLDTGLFRIPKEKIGYSNNAKGKFGPAKWDDVRFAVTTSDVTIEIQLADATD